MKRWKRILFVVCTVVLFILAVNICPTNETGEKRINESRDYILNNWTAARLRVKRAEGVIGSSTEGHVYHVLSSRMSTRPMGWSLVGELKMSELRA